MQSQFGFNTAEKYFQKGEYIAIGHDSFKMLSHPKSSAFEGCRVYAFLGNDVRVNEKLLSSLCEYAKSASFYKSDKKDQKLYVLCLFSKDEFGASERTLLCKNGRNINGTFCFSAGLESVSSKVFKSQKPPLLASAKCRSTFSLFNKITTD